MRSNERRCVALGHQDSNLLRIVPDATKYQCTQKHMIGAYSSFQHYFFYLSLFAYAASQRF